MTEYPVYNYCITDGGNPGLTPEMTQTLYDLMFRYADTFSFSRPGYRNRLPDRMNPKKTPLRDRLRPYFVKKIHADGWYGWPGEEVEVFIYRCCGETREILWDLVPELFVQPTTDRFYGLVYPEFEDLCFYRKGKMLLGSLSHEFMCTVYPPEDEIFPADILNTIGKWQPAVCSARFDIIK